jgi:hypothetical protein
MGYCGAVPSEDSSPKVTFASTSRPEFLITPFSALRVHLVQINIAPARYRLCYGWRIANFGRSIGAVLMKDHTVRIRHNSICSDRRNEEARVPIPLRLDTSSERQASLYPSR